MKQEHEIYCQFFGKPSLLKETRILTKINGILVLKNLDNPIIDLVNKSISQTGRETIFFHSEIILPSDLEKHTGRLFSMVEDEDELEQSTSILTEEGIIHFTGSTIAPFIEHINKGIQHLQFPETMFFSIIDNSVIAKELLCENWNINYLSIGKKYRYKKIINKNQKNAIDVKFLPPNYDIGVSDCTQKKPNGTIYMFQTENNYTPINLCSNESAVDFCIKNNCIIFFQDFINKGKIRILSPNTVKINKNLGNRHAFKSLNL